MPSRATSKDGQLRITHVTINDSGVYECTASNNVGIDAHDTIEVRVQGNLSFLYFNPYAPSITSIQQILRYIPEILNYKLMH